MQQKIKNSLNSNNYSPVISSWLTIFLACACGLTAANIYYAQPIIGPIGSELNLSESIVGLIVTLTQIGYGLGLLLVVPLGDMFENRRLSISILCIGAIGLLISGLSTSIYLLLVSSFLVGLGSVTVQILVPYAASLASDKDRGKVVGNVMSGLMLGIMFARPIASSITSISSWRMVFFLSCAVILILMIFLKIFLPPREIEDKIKYPQILKSMVYLVKNTPSLRRRAFYHACLFGSFSLFWTTVPLLLASDKFNLSQSGIALFALAGVAGAIAAPIVGRLNDNWIKPGTAIALILGIASFAITHIFTLGSTMSLVIFVISGMLLDFAVSGNLVLGQRVIFALSPEYRSRLNGLYMTTFFCGGAVGSAVGSWAYATNNWNGSSIVGMIFIGIAFIYFLTEKTK